MAPSEQGFPEPGMFECSDVAITQSDPTALPHVLNPSWPKERFTMPVQSFTRAEVKHLLTVTGDEQQALFARARQVRRETCGEGVLLRGLIEISNYCQKQCDYCGMRRNNKKLERS